MEWDDLRYLLATARSGSFLGAAQRLRVAHTTVGRRVRALEQDFGRPLFKRTRDGVTPTEFCEKILPTVREMDRQVQKISLAETHTDRQPEGLVRVHAADWVIRHLLIPDLPVFHRKYPKIRVFLVGDVVDSIVDEAAPGISIRAEGMAKRNEVEAELTRMPFSVYKRRGTASEDLLWATSSGGKMNFSQMRWLNERGVSEEEITAQANDAGLVQALIETGGYKGLCPHYLARASGTFERVFDGQADHFRQFRMIVHRRSVSLAYVQIVMDWLKERFIDTKVGEV